MLRYLIYLLRIRRIEFRLAEIPILLLPVFLLFAIASLVLMLLNRPLLQENQKQ